MPVEFDVSGARKAGYSDSDIANHLGKMRPDFDMAAARKSGYADDEIVHFLQTGKPYDRTYGEGAPAAAANVGRGVVGGLGKTAGVVAAGIALTNPLIAATEGAALLTGRESPIVGPLYKKVSEGPTAISEAVTGDPRTLTYENVESLPPQQRPFAVGGEVIGSSVPFAGLPIAVARTGAT